VKVLESIIQEVTLITENLWNKHFKSINIIKHSKEWWNIKCNRDLSIYWQSKRKYDWIIYRKLVKAVKWFFFDNKIQEITWVNERP